LRRRPPGGSTPASGSVTLFVLTSDPGPQGIAASPNETVWFTQETKGNIANITNAGVLTESKVVKGSGPSVSPWTATHSPGTR
jgi:streptogramin lyase